jgi:hypothetical protein
MQASATQAAYLLHTCDRWLSGLDDADRAWSPAPDSKTAGWLIGHLVITGDFGRRLCGLPPLAPKEWRTMFAPGTVPSSDPARYPPMADLVGMFRSVYTDFVAQAPLASPDALAVPNPYEPARGAFPTARSFVVYMLTGHLAYHLGQLSVWRSARAAVEPRLRQS